ncbi:MAG: hypothetical protein M5U28_28400 [Sandaracinaceae bacterium]|nr:hypothetical protein [Sandaracinaceae bacterium]
MTQANLDVDEDTGRLLQRYGFDLETFASLRERLRRGEAGPAQNRIAGRVEPPEPGDVQPLPPLGERGARAADREGPRLHHARRRRGGGARRRDGHALRRRGEGRRGGRGRPELPRAEAPRRAEPRGAHRRARPDLRDDQLRDRRRGVAARVLDDHPGRAGTHLPAARVASADPEGELLRGDDGRPSPYAPGHGDLPFALRRAGLLAAFREQGATSSTCRTWTTSAPRSTPR